MATAGRISGTIIQTLRHLGKDQVDDNVTTTLRRHLSAADYSTIRKDLVFPPAWIADLLRRVIETSD